MQVNLTLHNGVNRAGFLAITTVDALGHVDIVTGRPATSILTLLSFDSNGLSRANGLAELASNAAFLTGGIAAQSVLATETGRDGTLLERIEDGVSVASRIKSDQLIRVIDYIWAVEGQLGVDKNLRWAEVLLQHDVHAAHHLG